MALNVAINLVAVFSFRRYELKNWGRIVPLSANFAAAIYMLLAMGIFTIGDSITKYLLTSMSIGQYMFIRAILATLIIGLIARYHGTLKKYPFSWPVIIRVGGEAVATITYIYALGHLSQAFASAVFQVTPLAVTVGAIVFLSEKVGWRRWVSIMIGFAGVIIIIRPGGVSHDDAFPVAVLIMSIIAATARDLATRCIPASIPTLYLSTLTSAVITCVALILLLVDNSWGELTYTAFGLCLAAAIMLLIGYNFIIMAMRQGDISFISPFRYTSLLWAIVLSTVIFGQAPDFYTLVGSSIVISSGIYMVYRENLINKRKKKDARSSMPTGIDPS